MQTLLRDYLNAHNVPDPIVPLTGHEGKVGQSLFRLTDLCDELKTSKDYVNHHGIWRHIYLDIQINLEICNLKEHINGKF